MYTKIILKGPQFRKIKYYCKSIFNQIAVGYLFQTIVNTIKFNYDSLLVNSTKLRYNCAVRRSIINKIFH